MGYTCNTGVVTLKKILVSIPEGVHNLIREMKGKLGESDSEIIRNIVIAYLSEQGYFSKFGVITGVASSENIT
jgi:metal-responsive CopG/Arc/MetJ family transcriptional regulator